MTVVSLNAYRVERGLIPHESESEYRPVPRKRGPRPPRERIGGLSYYPKLGVWKASNVQIYDHSLTATSYGWWRMVERIGGRVVFNDYRYSNSTSKHQLKVRRFLRERGIEYVSIESPRGLQDLESAIRYYEIRIEGLEQEIAKPRTQAKKNAERRAEIETCREKIRLVKKLMRSQGGAA